MSVTSSSLAPSAALASHLTHIFQSKRLRLTSLNLNGVRSAARKGLVEWLQTHQPDVLCVQELKAQTADIQGTLDALPRVAVSKQVAGHAKEDLVWQGYFHCAQKKGYSGVGVYTRVQPNQVIFGFDDGEFDVEGRYIEARFDGPKQKFSIISVYFPSGTTGTVRQDAKYRFLDKMFAHVQSLRRERELVICADVNIAHKPEDLKNWKSNQKNSGFLPQECAWMDQLLDNGVVDVYRHLEPDATGACYTWWSNRGAAYDNNVGWRLDYQLSTPALADLAQSAAVYKEQKFSDHAPLTIEYALGASPSNKR